MRWFDQPVGFSRPFVDPTVGFSRPVTRLSMCFAVPTCGMLDFGGSRQPERFLEWFSDL